MASMFAGWEELKAGQHRAAFYRAWQAAMRAGFPHPRTMEMVGAQHPSVEPARRAVAKVTGAGRSLAAAIASAPSAFEPFEAGLLEAGEESGTLEETFRLLARHFTAKHTLMMWVAKQLSYPLVTAIAACFIAPLPFLVFGAAGLYLVLSVGGALLLVWRGGAFVGAVSARYANRPPLVRARLARALATAIAAGLPLDRVTSLAAAASGSPLLVAHVERFTPRERATQTIAETFAGAPLLGHDFHAMLAIGDATGDYATSLGKLADLLEDGFR